MRPRTARVVAAAVVAGTLGTIGVVQVAGRGSERDEVLVVLQAKVRNGELDASVVEWLESSGQFPTAELQKTIAGFTDNQKADFQVRLEQASVRFFAAAEKLGELWMPYQKEYDSSPPEGRTDIVVGFVDRYKDDLPALIKESQAVEDLFAEIGIVTP